ncbi:hypothetical protein ANO11243_091170 [Dothideomycetidae sp. 11243]|nr:hypothetical protein ANO11243_091170 [fungal sp. No.11243]
MISMSCITASHQFVHAGWWMATILTLTSQLHRDGFLHGGPGSGHVAQLPYAELWKRCCVPVIVCDQIDCGQSTHLPDTLGNEKLWQESLFISELENLIDYFQLRDGPGYHLLGSSWGAMMGSTFASQQPKGLRSLVLASTCQSRATEERPTPAMQRAPFASATRLSRCRSRQTRPRN